MPARSTRSILVDNGPASERTLVDTILDQIISEKSDMENLRLLFQKIDTDGSQTLDQDEFIQAFSEWELSAPLRMKNPVPIPKRAAKIPSISTRYPNL